MSPFAFLLLMYFAVVGALGVGAFVVVIGLAHGEVGKKKLAALYAVLVAFVVLYVWFFYQLYEILK